MYYDLHIHSALSPCGDDTMTINNIFNMSYIKGLELIAITDHNSLKQQNYLEEIINHEILKGKIDYIHGVELQSKEEIHILAYFLKDTDLKPIQAWIDSYLIKVPNNPDYYGNQYIFNVNDEIIDHEDNLLISSLDLDIYQIIETIHSFNGIAVLAHVLAKKFGVSYEIYQGIPDDLAYDGIEVGNLRELKGTEKKDALLCVVNMSSYNSDAHNLEAINEPVNQINKDDFYQLWRKI